MVLSIGHRGAAGHEPENTLRGFDAAVGLGADMVELDVHLCATGELVVIHDETVDRTTNGRGAVAGMTLRELKALDAGKGESIPTLGEVFGLMRGRAGVNIELKGRGTAEPVHDFLNLLFESGDWAPRDVLVSSFDWGMLGRVKELSPVTRVGPLAYDELGRSLDIAKELGTFSVNPYHGKIDGGFVGEAYASGLRVYPWTVDEPADIRRVFELGVDGVITDYPDRLRGYE